MQFGTFISDGVSCMYMYIFADIGYACIFEFIPYRLYTMSVCYFCIYACLIFNALLKVPKL